MEENNTQLIDDNEIVNPNENEDLISEEKKESDKDKERLISILDQIKSQLVQENKRTLGDVYISYTAEQFMENKTKKFDNLSCKSKLCYKFSLFIITSINLIGSFLIISLKKSYWNFFLTSLKCKFEIYCDKEDFRK